VEDAKFTFEFIKKWKFPMYAEAGRTIDSVEIKDARTLRFHLKQPYAPFVANILLVTIIAPKHIWEKIPESVSVKNPMDWPNPKPVGSGPYTFAEWKKKEYFHFKANKEHFIGPNFEGFYYLFVPTVEGMMAMLEKEQAEIYGFALDAVQAAKLDAMPHLTKVRVNSHSVTEIRPNFKMKPMDDPKFRRALQYVIDRKKLLDVIYQGEGVVGRTTPLAPILAPWHNPNVTFFEYDLDKARKILKEAGYTWDDKGRLCYPE
jgi:peptide/nickel transport system substrate-binding protein